MNNISNELKIGIIVLASIFVAYIGFRIMKDEPFFSSSNVIYTKYAHVEGLLKGANVSLIGLKIGTVKELQYLPDEDSIRVSINVTEDVVIPVGSQAKLVVPNLIGSSTIEIIKSSNPTPLEWGSTIKGVREDGLLSEFSEKGGSIADSASTTLDLTNQLLRSFLNLQEKSSEDISGTISNLKESTETLNGIIQERKMEVDSMIVDARNTLKNLSEMSDSSKGDIESLIANLEQFSGELDALGRELKVSTESISSILSKIDIGEGTLGKMVNDPSLYNNLDSLTVNLNELIKGIQEDPKRYLKHMRLIEIF
ncbi:MAG: MlaD family protein [Balneola sp.]